MSRVDEFMKTLVESTEKYRQSLVEIEDKFQNRMAKATKLFSIYISVPLTVIIAAFGIFIGIHINQFEDHLSISIKDRMNTIANDDLSKISEAKNNLDIENQKRINALLGTDSIRSLINNGAKKYIEHMDLGSIIKDTINGLAKRQLVTEISSQVKRLIEKSKIKDETEKLTTELSDYKMKIDALNSAWNNDKASTVNKVLDMETRLTKIKDSLLQAYAKDSTRIDSLRVSLSKSLGDLSAKSDIHDSKISNLFDSLNKQEKSIREVQEKNNNPIQKVSLSQ